MGAREPAPAGSALELVEQKARDHLSVYLESRDRWNFARSLKRLSEEAAREYEDRFLVELIQNGYDAHDPDERHGRIRVSLARDEGRYGTLYVANSGSPFTYGNFESLCEIAQSDKTPGESVGNKGVGFRSVLQVCAWPEIYSGVDGPPKGRLDGFCFGFARPADVLRLVEGDGAAARDVARDVSAYFLPVPLTEQDEPILLLARDGFATVVRLPLETDLALQVAEEQVRQLRQSEAPLTLFLERLERLEITTTGGSQPAETTVLTRTTVARPLGAQLSGAQVEDVDLDGQGRWLVASRAVDKIRLAATLAESVEAGHLDPNWLEWKAPAVVSVAARTDADNVEPRIYTYLPMGKSAPAPFWGHLNAPFATKLARLDINDRVPLNALFLDAAAELCADVVRSARHSHDAIPDRAAVDLVVWNDAHFERITRAFEKRGDLLERSEIVPIDALKDGTQWTSPTEAHEWPGEFKCFTRKALVDAADATLVPASLGTARTERLHDFCTQVDGRGLKPTAEMIAQWAETLAADLATRKFAPRRWDSYYDELAQLFDADPDSLRGRRILLDDELKLHATPDPAGDPGQPNSRVLVYFPPARERTDDEDEIDPDADVRPPASLKRYLVPINDRLTWNVRDGSRRRQKPSRLFLQTNRFVRRFRTQDLLEHTGTVLQPTKSTRVFADALRFAYTLIQASGTPKGTDVARLNLRVPTAEGWTPARRATLSGEWSPGGATLEQLIQRTRTVSTDLAALEQRLVKPPNDWPFPVRDRPSWLAFMRLIGVRDGLAPIVIQASTTELEGRHVRPGNLARKLRLSERDAQAWEQEVSASSSHPFPMHPQTPYRARHGISVLPGQRNHAEFDEQARLLYAELLLEGLATWPSSVLQIEFFRPRHPGKPDATRWPSPVSVFLARGAWMPIASPRETSAPLQFVTPADAWHVEEREAPRYVPFLLPELRLSLDRAPQAVDRLRPYGFKTWDNPEDAPAVIRTLGLIAAARVLIDSDQLGFKRTYREAWGNVVARQLENPFDDADNKQQWLPVIREGRVDAIALDADESDSAIYVIGRTRNLTTQLLEAIGEATVQVEDAAVPAVAALLRERLGSRIREATEVEVAIELDERSFTPSDGGVPLVTPERRWLPLLIGLALEFRAERFDRRGERGQRAALERLRQIRLWEAATIAVTIDAKPVALPSALSNALPVDDDDFPAIVATGTPIDPTWRYLEEIMPSVTDLIGAPRLAPDVALAVVHLARQDGSPDLSAPTDEALAAALGITPEQVIEVRKSASSGIEVSLDRLIPVLACIVGDEAAATLADARDATEDELLQLLQNWSGQLTVPPAELLSLCESAPTLSHVRDSLELDYATFNAALRRLTGYEPIHNADGHGQSMEWFKREKREAILHRLRTRFLDEFDAGRSLAVYASARTLKELRPDQGWLDYCDLPTDEMLETQVTQWLAEIGTPPLPEVEHTLQPLDELRTANLDLSRAAARNASTAVVAWCAKNKAALPGIWDATEPPTDRIPDLLDADGRLDFRPLNDADVVAWLADHAHWPALMPQSLTASDLGLTEADLRAGEQREEEAKRRQEIARRSVTLDGKTYSAIRSDLRELAEATRTAVPETFLQSSARLTKLEQVRDLKRTRTANRKGGRASPGGRVTDAQLAAIGLVGEVAAHEWLKRRYGAEAADGSWRSGYRDVVLGGTLGDDGLGYDFEIVLRTKTNLYEVKSTTTDVMQIELGESQVNIARRYATSSRYDFRILFLMNVLDSSKRTIHPLPNPFSPQHRDFFRLVGSGLTYRFELS